MSTMSVGRIALALAAAVGIVGYEAVRLSWERADHPPRKPPKRSASRDCVGPQWPSRLPSRAESLTDVTDASGLDFQHVVGPLGTYFMPESIGAGGGLLDFDGDGRLDVYLVNCGRSPQAVGEFPPGTRVENRLFRQTEQGTFEDVTAHSGLGDTGYGAGCAIGDINNDGLPDVYVTNYGRDRLFQNNGDGTFRDVTLTSGIDNTDWGTSAAFFDYNRDGRLDLIVVNYTADPQFGHSVACGFPRGTVGKHNIVSYCGPHKFQPTVDRLFRNDGLKQNEQGQQAIRFTDVTKSAGLDAVQTYGFGVVCADLTRDGWPDVFVTNDGDANRLWVNQRDGTFSEEAKLRGAAYNRKGVAEAGMGVAVGDVNHDDFTDLVVTHLSRETTTLYQSLGSDGFTDATETARLDKPTYPRTGWGAALVDLNHDGALDLPLVHGLVIPCHSGFPFHGEDTFIVRRDRITDAKAFWQDYADANLLLMGDGQGGFRDASLTGGDFCAAVASGRSLISGDLDNDGDIDLLVTNCGGRARLYRNDFAKQGHWLTVRAIDPRHNRDAYGAEIVVKTGGRTFLQIASPAFSYLASNDPRVHFGLGDAAKYDEIIVRWPDGPVNTSTEVFPGGAVDRFVVLRRGEGRALRNVQ